jgi:hypothetical protein
MPKVLSNIDLTLQELQNAKIHILAADPGSAAEGQLYYNSVSKVLKYYTGSAWIVLGRLDQVSTAGADVAMGSHKITGLADGSAASDAATKGQLDAITAGLSWKDSVRAATVAPGTFVSAFADGETIDTVELATGDRILLKNQADDTENGIYVVQATGAPVRATDADTAADLINAAVFIEEGSQADTAWVGTADQPISLGTTPLPFAQFSGGTVSAGAGLTQTGSVFDVVAADGSITVNANDITVGLVPVGKGGTGLTAPTDHSVLLGHGASAVVPLSVGATNSVLKGNTGADPSWGSVDLATAQVSGVLPTTAGGTGSNYADLAALRTALTVPVKVTADCDAATTTTVTHNLNTRDVQVSVYRATSPWDEVLADITHLDTNNIVVTFAVAPTLGQYRIVVIG